jgi:predicted ATP-dependent serine protease
MVLCPGAWATLWAASSETFQIVLIMDEIFLDCTTKDLERLKRTTNNLMLAFQAMQVEVTQNLEIRDQMIVIVASLEQLHAVAIRSTKKSSTPRFVRTIQRAVQIAKSFGTGTSPAPKSI